MPAFHALPTFLAESGYQNPTDPKACAWQKGHDTDNQFFPWLVKRPELLRGFNDFMAMPRPNSKNSFADHFPSECIFSGSDRDSVLFVYVYVIYLRLL